jgi:hypothetical protein
MKYSKYVLGACGLLFLGYAMGTYISQESENLEIDGDETSLLVSTENMKVLPKPDWGGKTNLSVLHTLGLVQTKKETNDVTDEDRWFEVNDLQSPEYDVDPESGTVPLSVPQMFDEDNKLIKGIQQADHNIYLYGPNFSKSRYMVILNAENTEALYVLDLSNYQTLLRVKPDEARFAEPRVRWAQMDNQVLYLSFGHNTYSSSSYGENSYLVAIDLETMSTRWTSKPLTCNSNNFIITGEYIVCGYGFTYEPDYLFTVDKGTGKRLETIRLDTGPEWIFKKGNDLYVRTYNKNYEFHIGH